MISNRPTASPASPLQGRAWALPLLVMAVLCGLLAMHGLGAAPPPETHPHRATAHSAPEAAAAGGHAAGRHAAHGTAHVHAHGTAHVHAHGNAHVHGDADGESPRIGPGDEHAGQCECDGLGGHVAHADAACSASGTSGSPSMDGPASIEAAGPQPEEDLDGWCRPDTGAERAPPSLHRLQLLRI
ncbi:hypothetical protein G4Z16_21160 [Streptomyces bathyalis]|uniref:Uncharacterized protein n=1 Tax=Streptomyces bathyalis TaxID=2710756 RepID=A0A7T1T8S7_9ACTN|nr:DUF6153 family protein [Streptomyces bathyalis]QPP08491.1 hypothetical protein G4Z16_21160 [Streptomyces bathyalis]